METIALLSIGYIVIGALMWRQQRTIERLTDKLMAKDYGEYKRHEQKVMIEESPQRKPLSFYDDNTVVIED